MGSNITNNPYVQSINKSVLNNITSQVTSVVSNLTLNTQGGLSSVASTLASALAGGGVNSSGGSDTISAQLDSIVSGASSYFTTDNPERITQNSIVARNNSAGDVANPSIQIPSSQSDTTGGSNFQYPNSPGKYTFKLSFGKYQRQTPLGNSSIASIGSIVLPLPAGGGMVDNTTAAWTGAEMGIAGNVLDNLGNVDAIKSQILSGDWKGMMNGTAGDAAVYAGDYLLKKLGGDSVAGAAESYAGIAPNPALAQMFKGVPFRNFRFAWTFAPKSSDESNTIKDIINYIKSMQLPTLSGQGQNGGSSYLFNYPNVCQPSFSEGADYLTQFKWCVIKEVNVNYAPQGLPAFYAGTSAPAIISLEIVLEEMVYLLATDYDSTRNGTSGVGAVQAAANNLMFLVTPGA